jgi:EmrB/QacA subfamily drug resistance transporter
LRIEASALGQITPRSRRLIVAGILLSLIVSSSNQTVVSTALPRIVGDLGGLNLLSWVFTAYMLATTITVPLSGKLSDLYGRKPFLIGGVALFTTASAAAGLSQSIEQLIVLRGVQGVGGGMIMANTFAVIGDLFPPAERGKYQGIFSSIFGISSVVGPTIGGLLTDHLSWRYVFYVNVPFALAALTMIWFFLPWQRRQVAKRSIDYAGMALMAAAVTSLLLALVWGGDVYAWGSPEIVGLIVLSSALTAAFLYNETKAPEPVIPIDMFRNRLFSAASLLTFVSAVGIFGYFIYLPVLLQGALGSSATNSGIETAPMMVGIVLAGIFSGMLVARTGRYRNVILIGGGLTVIGAYFLAQIDQDSSYLAIAWPMVAFGTGVGLGMPMINVVVQSIFAREHLGVASSSTQFFRQIGGTFGVAIFGTLIVTGLQANLEKNLSPEIRSQIPPAILERLEEPQTLLNEDEKAEVEALLIEVEPNGTLLAETALSATRLSLADAVTSAFMVGFVILAAAFALSFPIEERRLQRSWDEPLAATEDSLPPPPVQPLPATNGHGPHDAGERESPARG